MTLKEIFKEIKNDYEEYGEVFQMEYFDDYINGTRYIFRVEGDKLIIYLRNDIEEIEVIFTMDINFILESSINECIKTFNKYCYYAPNIYEQY